MSELNTNRSELMERLKWMRRGRLGGILVILLIYLVANRVRLIVFPVKPFIILCIIEGLINQPYPFIVSRMNNLGKLAVFHLVIDLLLISGIIHYLGGIEFSLFNAIYPLVIIATAIVLSRDATFKITTLASILYSVLVALEFYRLIPHVPLLGLELKGPYQFGLVVANVVFFYFIAFVSTYSSNVIEEKNREMLKAKEYAENMLGLMADSLVVVDKKGEVVNINKSAKDLLKYDGEQIVGQDFVSAFCTEEDRARMRNILSNFRGDKHLTDIEIELLCTDGGRVPVRMSASMLKNGGVGKHMILMVFHDITLERDSDRIKAAFLTNISHELKTPLSVIKGFTKTLIEDHQISEKDRSEFLRIMDVEGERLEKIISALVDLAKIEVGKVNIKKEKGQLLDVLKEVTDKYVAEAHIRNLLYHIKFPAQMTLFYFDEENIRRVLEHLIGNAFRFTPRGEIAVEAEEEQERLMVSVRDTGAGIPENELPFIFHPVYVDKNEEAAIGKMNIKLPVVKHIVEAHGGSIWAKSKLEEGTRFTFTIPKVI